MIEIITASPFATVQDQGFPSGRAWGLPPGGAMDPVALRRANELVGNPAGAAAIEWALGPLVVRPAVRTRLAVLGPASVTMDEVELEPLALAFGAPAGSTLRIEPGPRQRYSYLAVRGGIAVPELLGSRSTYLPGGLGGLEGRRLRAGDRLPLLPLPDPTGGFDVTVPELLEVAGDDVQEIRVTRGPQWQRFDTAVQQRFLEAIYTVAADADRMGYRLSGPPIQPREQATLASEAACPGAVQIPDGGQPIVLMPDGPTVGGYPKLAVVIRADLRRLAQSAPGRAIRFREVSLEAARACYSENR